MKAADPSRAAYIVKIGRKYWSRDRGTKRAGKKVKRADRGLKDFYGAGIITTLALATRIANYHKGRIVPVTIKAA